MHSNRHGTARLLRVCVDAASCPPLLTGNGPPLCLSVCLSACGVCVCVCLSVCRACQSLYVFTPKVCLLPFGGHFVMNCLSSLEYFLLQDPRLGLNGRQQARRGGLAGVCLGWFHPCLPALVLVRGGRREGGREGGGGGGRVAPLWLSLTSYTLQNLTLPSACTPPPPPPPPLLLCSSSSSSLPSFLLSPIAEAGYAS
jgi:hypothetical protein